MSSPEAIEPPEEASRADVGLEDVESAVTSALDTEHEVEEAREEEVGRLMRLSCGVEIVLQ